MCKRQIPDYSFNKILFILKRTLHLEIRNLPINGKPFMAYVWATACTLLESAAVLWVNFPLGVCTGKAFVDFVWVPSSGLRNFLVRPKAIACGADLRFSPDVFLHFFSEHEISEMCGPTGLKFCTMVSNRPYFIMPVKKKFGGRTPKKFRGRKTCKIWPDFGQLWSSAANISEMDEDIQNRISIPFTAIPFALGETSPVKFGPVTLEISMWNRTHPKCIFWKTIFRPVGGAAPPNFHTR